MVKGILVLLEKLGYSGIIKNDGSTENRVTRHYIGKSPLLR